MTIKKRPRSRNVRLSVRPFVCPVRPLFIHASLRVSSFQSTQHAHFISSTGKTPCPAMGFFLSFLPPRGPAPPPKWKFGGLWSFLPGWHPHVIPCHAMPTPIPTGKKRARNCTMLRFRCLWLTFFARDLLLFLRSIRTTPPPKTKKQARKSETSYWSSGRGLTWWRWQGGCTHVGVYV